MTDRLITPEAVVAARLARYPAADLIAYLVQVGMADHAPSYLDALHAEWAWEQFDRLAEHMAKIPRPPKAAEAAA